jgi:hypothetical protein
VGLGISTPDTFAEGVAFRMNSIRSAAIGSRKVPQLLDKISAGPRPKPPDLPQREDYGAAFEEIPGDNWKTM